MPKAARTTVTPDAPRPRATSINVNQVDWMPRAFGSASGPGNAAEQIVLALEALGTNVRIVGDPHVTGIQNAEAIAQRVNPELGEAIVVQGDPTSWMRDTNRRSYGFGICDADRLPARWIASLTNVDEIWVPSPWCADIFAAATEKPVYVVPFGVDADAFAYSRRTRGQKLRILYFTTRVEVRKGADLAIGAFRDAFGDREDVELVIRMTHPGDVVRNDPRISIDGGVIGSAELAMYYRSFDALIAPSRSEAFGLIPLEAMATGMPAIFTDASGMSQYRELGLPVSARAVPAIGNGSVGDMTAAAPWGRWFMPNPDELVDRLREIDAHYDRIMDAAESDAAAIATNWTWRRTAEKIVARLNA